MHSHRERIRDDRTVLTVHGIHSF